MLQKISGANAFWVLPVIGALLLATSPRASWAATDPFNDDDGMVHEAAITALHTEGVAQGCAPDEHRYCPEETIRRDQLASFLVRGLDLPSTSEDFFNDDEGNVHEDNINALKAAGISHGCNGSGGFCPDEPVLRAQMASLLVRAIELPSTKRDFFDDVGGVHAYPINKIAAAGITAGCAEGRRRYCPDDPVLRGQMATFLARGLGMAPRVEVPEPAPPAKAKAEATRNEVPWGVWDRLAQCESSGNWSINTGNGYYGGLQFSLQSWRGVGGSGYPHQHSRAEQIRRAELLKARQGWGAWPACSRKLGLR